MTFDPYGKEYRAAKELRNCGFTPESINAIQSTTIITRDGAQHVVPISQAHLDERKLNAQISQQPIESSQQHQQPHEATTMQQ